MASGTGQLSSAAAGVLIVVVNLVEIYRIAPWAQPAKAEAEP